MGLLRLIVDRQNKRLVIFPGSGGITALPDLFQGNVVTLSVSVVDPTGGISIPYSFVTLSSFGLRASIGATPTGTSGGPTPLAIQTTFTISADGKTLTGDLALNTVAIDSHIGATAGATAYFELNLTLSGNRETILQTTFQLKAVVDEQTSTAPSPTDQYLTKAECLALFQKMLGDLGQRLTFRSPSGTKGREIGVDDDGNGIDNIITL